MSCAFSEPFPFNISIGHFPYPCLEPGYETTVCIGCVSCCKVCSHSELRAVWGTRYDLSCEGHLVTQYKAEAIISLGLGVSHSTFGTSDNTGCLCSQGTFRCHKGKRVPISLCQRWAEEADAQVP